MLLRLLAAAVLALGLSLPAWADIAVSGGSPGGPPPTSTIAGLPTCDNANQGARRTATDASTPSSCTTGGGANRNVCRCDDNVWEFEGAGAVTAGDKGDITVGALWEIDASAVGVNELAVNACTEPKLDIIDSPVDEESLTYEGTGARFEWEPRISGATTGGGLVTAGAAGAPTIGMLTSCSSGQLLEWNGSAWACANDDTGGGGGAPTDAQYITGASNGTLSAEIFTTAADRVPLSNGSSATWAQVPAGAIASDAVTEQKLDARDTPADEEVLTFESTDGRLEWQPSSSGDDINVDGTPTASTAPNFSDSGDINFNYSAPNITGAVKADSVALGTDTTGNYLNSATTNGGLVVTGAGDAQSIGLGTTCLDQQVKEWDTDTSQWVCSNHVTALAPGVSGSPFTEMGMTALDSLYADNWDTFVRNWDAHLLQVTHRWDVRQDGYQAITVVPTADAQAYGGAAVAPWWCSYEGDNTYFNVTGLFNSEAAYPNCGWRVGLVTGPTSAELETGTVLSHTTTSLTVSGTPFATDEFNGQWLLVNYGNTAKEGKRRIIDTTTNSITFATLSGSFAVIDGSTFKVRGGFGDGSDICQCKWHTTPSPASDAVGVATTGSTSTTLEVSGTPWAADEWIGYWVVLRPGTGREEWRYIQDNDTNTLTLTDISETSQAWHTNPANLDPWQIHSARPTAVAPSNNSVGFGSAPARSFSAWQQKWYVPGGKDTPSWAMTSNGNRLDFEWPKMSTAFIADVGGVDNRSTCAQIQLIDDSQRQGNMWKPTSGIAAAAMIDVMFGNYYMHGNSAAAGTQGAHAVPGVDGEACNTGNASPNCGPADSFEKLTVFVGFAQNDANLVVSPDESTPDAALNYHVDELDNGYGVLFHQGKAYWVWKRQGQPAGSDNTPPMIIGPSADMDLDTQSERELFVNLPADFKTLITSYWYNIGSPSGGKQVGFKRSGDTIPDWRYYFDTNTLPSAVGSMPYNDRELTPIIAACADSDLLWTGNVYLNQIGRLVQKPNP